MNKHNKYIEFKTHLQGLILTPKEYERRLKDWCRANKY